MAVLLVAVVEICYYNDSLIILIIYLVIYLVWPHKYELVQPVG